MGVGVEFTGFAVGGPAGVTDPGGAADGVARIGLFREQLQPALGLDHPDRTVAVPDSDACRVVSTIFQFGKAVEQNGSGLMLAGKSYDSAHN